MRCRKAHWYLSARCDGTLSERQRLRLEAHLETCEECRREAFYFAEIGSMAPRMASHSVQPDFNLRLRAAIRRAEDDAAHPVSWQSRVAGILLRPALVAASIVVLGIGGLGAWSMMKSGEVPSTAAALPDAPSVSPEFGLAVHRGQTVAQSGELVPVIGLDEEARRLRERYLQAGKLPHEYVSDGVTLNDSNGRAEATRYVLPTVSPDQVTKKESY